jgi:hypothetical protein
MEMSTQATPGPLDLTGELLELYPPSLPSPKTQCSSIISAKTFPFLNLPTEIRLQIYYHLLIKPNGFYIGDPNLRSTSSSPPANNPSNRFQHIDASSEIRYNPHSQLFLDFRSYRNTSFVLANCQIYTETSEIFYGRNGFNFSRCYAMHLFLWTLKLESRRHLRRLRFLPTDYSSYEMRHLFAVLIHIRVNFPWLQELELVYREFVVGEDHGDVPHSQATCLYDFYVRDPLRWLFRSPDFQHGPSHDMRDTDLTDEQRSHQGFMAFRSHETEDCEMPDGEPVFEIPRLNELAWKLSKTGRSWRPVFYVVIEEKSRWQDVMGKARAVVEVLFLRLGYGGESGGTMDDVDSGRKLENSVKKAWKDWKKVGLSRLWLPY